MEMCLAWGHLSIKLKNGESGEYSLYKIYLKNFKSTFQKGWQTRVKFEDKVQVIDWKLSNNKAAESCIKFSSVISNHFLYTVLLQPKESVHYKSITTKSIKKIIFGQELIIR